MVLDLSPRLDQFALARLPFLDEEINNSVLCDACLLCQCIALLTQALLTFGIAESHD